MLTPIKKSRVYEGVSRQIREQIEQGVWKEGERIQGELALAETFQVSRGSIREAIKSLQLAGLLEARSGQGTFVASNARQKIRDGRLSEKLSSDEYFDDILECRYLIEAYACQVAALHHTEEDLRFLRENYEKAAQYTLTGSLEDMNRCGGAFHLYIVDMAHNEIISGFYRSIVQPSMDERQEFFSDCEQTEISDSLHDHDALIRAFEAHDAARAKEIIRRHLECKKRSKNSTPWV